MASVCVCDCGFLVDGGTLCPDWHALGVKAGAVELPGTTTGTAVTTTWTLIQFIRLTYTNDTCHTQRVEINAYTPYVNFNHDNANYWDFALYLGAQLDTPFPSDTFFLPYSGRVRKSNPNPTVLNRFSVPVRATDRDYLVTPGRTLHMLASTWKNIYDSSGGGSNELSYGRFELNYKAWPDGA